MDATEIKELDVREALKKTNTGRTSRIGGIPVELYKANDDVAEKSCQNGLIRYGMKKIGLIVKLPNRGDLKECKN